MPNKAIKNRPQKTRPTTPEKRRVLWRRYEYMQAMRNKLILVLIFILNGCATGTPFVQLDYPNQDESVIYGLRPWHLFRGAATLDVLVNGDKVGDLQNGGYVRLVVTPGSGNYAISPSQSAKFIGWPSKVLQIDYDIEPGETKYFVLAVDGNSLTTEIYLVETNEDVALKYLVKLKALDGKNS